MVSFRQSVISFSLVGVVLGQGVILSAQGAKGSPKSLSLQVDTSDERDANFISQSEIVSNIVNECGRTTLAGNIDVGANTEDALAADQVTQVTQGSDVAVTIRQVNETGAGPFTCDMDLTSNASGISGQVNLTSTEKDADANGNIALTVTMPDDMKCIGASTGNVCTVRCKNAAGFGGCFAVQQTDTKANKNTPDNIAAKQKLGDIQAQVQQNIADLPAAVKGIAEAGDTEADKGVSVVEEIQAADPSTIGDEADNANADTGNNNDNNNNNNNNNNGNANTNTGNGNGRNGNGRNGNGRNGNGAANGAATGATNGATNGATRGGANRNGANGNNAANGNAANGNAANGNGNAANGNGANANNANGATRGGATRGGAFANGFGNANNNN